MCLACMRLPSFRQASRAGSPAFFHLSSDQSWRSLSILGQTGMVYSSLSSPQHVLPHVWIHADHATIAERGDLGQEAIRCAKLGAVTPQPGSLSMCLRPTTATAMQALSRCTCQRWITPICPKLPLFFSGADEAAALSQPSAPQAMQLTLRTLYMYSRR